MAGEAVFVIVVVALVVPFVLYSLVRAEHDQREEMDREDAERVARRDTRQDTRQDTPGDTGQRNRR